MENKIFFTKIITINNQEIGIASLNTSWLTKGGGQADYGHLFLTERQIERAYDEIKHSSLKIAVFHHTFDWLNQNEKQLIKNRLSEKFNIVLCGHNHENTAETLSGNIGELFISNTGCLYQSRDYFNGYTILKLDNNNVEVLAREYYHSRNTFDQATRFNTNGKKNYPLSISSKNTIPITDILYKSITQRANNKLLSSNSAIAPREVHNIFVEPPLAQLEEKEFYFNKEHVQNNNSTEYVKLNDLRNSTENILFLGKRESGKTTLLNYLIVEKYNEIYSQTALGIVIDLKNARTKDSNLSINLLLNEGLNFLDNELNKQQLKDLLLAGRILIGFDNFDTKSTTDLKCLRNFMENYPLSKYIAVSLEDESTLKTIKVDIDIFPKQVFIHSFKAKHTESLICKWFSSDTHTNSLKIKIIKKLITQLNVPSTPFLISMLLWVVEKQGTQPNLYNEASVVQVLIEGLLEKFQEKKHRENFDSTNLSHFLKEFSHELNIRETIGLDVNSFEKFKTQYLDERSLPVSTNLRQDLIEKGILFSDGEIVTFKFDCFRAYFLAEKFNTNNEIWKDIIQKNKAHLYTTEFEYYSGIYRDKEELLNEYLCLVENTFKELNLNIDQEALENDSSILLASNIFGEISDHVENNDFINSEEDLEELPHAASIDQSVSRNKQQPNIQSQKLNALLILRSFASILRNSELVANKSLKEISLDVLFTEWNNIFLYLLGMVKHDFETLFSNVSQNNNNELSEKEHLKTLFSLLITFMFAHLIVERASSSKLKHLFSRYFDSQNAGHRALALLCYIDIDTDEAINQIKKSIGFFRKKNFYLQGLFIYLLHKYMETNNQKIKKILGELSAAFLDVPNHQRHRAVEGFIKKFEKNQEQLQTEF
ncbi:hypothetical protein A6M14_02645 [Acinetobacter sp. Ac_877]|uniref:STAND family AAA ATPase n=1 Tax=Acinetobacter portensis TaxID=1839785 RepID=UPI00128AED51|nr:hypothetical protein [Acinetobacter portensis]MPW42772.1 hypothetical protein [Acinetobacter portensis]